MVNVGLSSNPIVALMLLSGVLMASALGCSDDANSPPAVDEAPDPCQESGDKLLVELQAPEPSSGVAPLSLRFEGQVLKIEEVDFNWTLDFGDGTLAQGINSQPSASHTFAEPGQYTVRLIATDETCQTTSTAEVSIEAVDPIELSGTGLAGSPQNLVQGERLTLSLEVVNSGSALSAPVEIAFHLSPSPNVRWGDVPSLPFLTSITLGSDDGGVTIGAGQSVAVEEEVRLSPSLLTGLYHLVAVIDFEDAIPEGDDEGNNIVVSTFELAIENTDTPAPQLLVSDVRVGPREALKRLTSISLNADIENVGEVATPSHYSVYLVTDPESPLEGVSPIYTSERVLFEVEPPNNALRVRSRVIELDEPIELGEDQEEIEVFIWVCVDPDDEVLEDNEVDNCALSLDSVLVTERSREGIDIAPTLFEMTPTTVALDSSAEITLEVSSLGTRPTGSFFCGVYLSEDEVFDNLVDTALTNFNFTNMAPGESRTQQRLFTFPGFLDTGLFNAIVFCDPSNAVEENNEDNNGRLLPEGLNILAENDVDLTISSFSFAPGSIEDGGDLDLTLTVTNSGQLGTTPTIVRVHRAASNNCGPSSPLVATVDVPSLDPMGSIDLGETISGQICEIFAETYTLCAEVDPENQTLELNESNNLTTAAEPLRFTGERCQCEPDTFDNDDDIATLSSGFYEDLTLCEGGDTDDYRVNLSAGQSLSVRMDLTFVDRCTNLDLQILDPNFQPIPDAISRTDGQIERASAFLVQAPGQYIVRIDGRTDCDVNSYDLTISVTDPEPGVDLTGTSLTLDDPSPVLGQEVTATLRTINLADDDAGPFEVALFLSRDAEIDDTDFELDTLTINDGLQGARARDDLASFNIPPEATDGTYLVCALLDANDAVTENNEDNNIICSDPIEVDAECYDPFEPNDLVEDATQIEPGIYEGLNVCNQGRMDNYRFCVEEGSLVVARVDFVDAEGNIDTRLFTDPDDDLVGLSIGQRDFEEIEIAYVDSDQCYIFQVYLEGGIQRSNDYSMTLSVTEADPNLGCEDLFEPNNTFMVASDLLEATDEDIVLDRCPENDFDFYRVELTSGTQFRVCAHNHELNPRDVDLNLTIYNAGQRQITADTGPNPCLTHTATSNGTHFVRLVAFAQDIRNVRYTLDIEGL